MPPKVELGDLDPPWENAIRAYRANGSIGSPAQPDNIGIGATLPLSPQTPYIPKAGMPASPLAPNWMRDRQTGQQQAIPMHMLPALPPHRHP
ncbi:hypothetical protein CEK28_05375 [Xenophilus sp. AP218F]|nr:hypothetical protein CEK28_05375 [Xenophilus sp. AP218F]